MSRPSSSAPSSPKLSPVLRPASRPTSTIHGSPLNPNATPPTRTTPLAHADKQLPPDKSPRERVHSFSTVRSSSPPLVAISRVASHPSMSEPPSLENSELFSLSHRSRSHSPAKRGRSPARADNAVARRAAGSVTPIHAQSQSWWSSREISLRPWHDSPRKTTKTIPAEQSERWLDTRKKVADAAMSILGTAADITYEIVSMGADGLRYAPIPGLEVAAQSLISIWDALQLVDMNRLSCLRLTERCADILMCIREEIYDAGDYVGQELYAPITKLVEAFAEVHQLLQKHINRPFLKRYLKRNDIMRDIQNCDVELTNALGMFSVSIQIRILRQIQDSDRQRQEEAQALMNAVLRSRGLPTAQQGQQISMDVPLSPSIRSDQIVAALKLLRDRQDQEDRSHDMDDLRGIMRMALQTKDDAEMIEVLQVSRHEMPEAIKSLQRALERELEREQEGDGMMVTEDVAVFSEDSITNSAQPSRSGTSESAESQWSERTQASSTSSAKARRSKDTLDREFLESGIDALRRMTKGAELTLPSWTITRYEVDREEKIGVGFFSDVYRGTWRRRTVAIKVLAPTTPRKLFVHEMEMWRNLVHPNVLELLGASSASGEPPWFFVSPYLKNGSLVKYLKTLLTLDQANPLRMIYEVAEGMEYLHEKGVLHGDLKGANVLVDDNIRCVIADFGQSEMKSEASRISGNPQPHGTPRWQAPELMTGQSKLTPAMDVYAFAITCLEILTKGGLPWANMDDDSVRYFVLKENLRPEIPASHNWSKALAVVISNCWQLSPTSRPPFSKIVKDLKNIGAKYFCQLELPACLPEPKSQSPKKSPDMHPKPLPPIYDITDEPYTTEPPVSPDPFADKHRHPAPYIPDDDSELSVLTSTPDTYSEFTDLHNLPGDVSPPPPDQAVADTRNERRYRLLLQHEFHPSLTLPLWSPSPVCMGAVGYLSKPEGSFVTLFNAFDPSKTSDGVMKDTPSLYGYGRVSQGSQRQDKRNPAQKGLDVIQSWISSKRDATKLSRRYSFALRAGHKTAFLCTESTMYKYMEDLAAPKQWFKANVNEIMDRYAGEHQITKEDLFLVIGTLSAPEYALFVSHNHPDGQVLFNIFSAQKNSRPWGEFELDTDVSSSGLAGPKYVEPIDPALSAFKVSDVNPSKKWDTVLLARLRFKPDVPEPTSL